jgi:hypothetical protein
VGASKRIPAVASRNRGVPDCFDGGIWVLACSRSGARYEAIDSGLSANEDSPGNRKGVDGHVMLNRM